MHQHVSGNGVRRWGREVGRAVFCLLFPSPCRLCGLPLRHARRLPVCLSCLTAAAAPAGLGLPVCRQCGDPVPAPAEDGRCLACRTAPPAYACARAATVYRGAARELILQLKFHGLRPAASFWAQQLEALARALPEFPHLVIPVPLGRQRQRQRGYNQSADIARHLARRLACAYTPGALHRQRETAPQSGLDRAARIRNLDGAFAASARVAGQRVLLIDDVFTTGATAHAAAAALRRAGARQVVVLTAARAALEFAAAPTARAAAGSAA